MRTRFLSDQRRLQLEVLASGLSACSPLGVLKRGYAIVTTGAGDVVRDPQDTSPGQVLDVRVAKGEFRVRRESQ